MKEKNNELLLDVGDTPPLGKWIILAIQHVFAMFGATVLVPILVNSQAGAEVLTIPIALIASGIGTICYLICTKGKSPVYLGSSFAFIVPMAVGFGAAGKAGIFTAVMIVGIINLIVALIIRFVGSKWIDKILPPIVIGPMIMIIGLGLSSSAVMQMGLTGEAISWKPLLVIAVTFVSTVIAAVYAKGFFKIIPFLTGIVFGYICSLLVGMVDYKTVLDATWVSIPNFVLPFIHYTPNFGAVLTIVPVALVTMSEHIGDHKALSEIIGKDLIKDPGLSRTFMGDGVATFIAGFLGGADTTTYGENLAVVGMTKIASVKVIGLAAVFAIILSFFGKFIAVINTIPSEVLGSISILLYGFISVNGLKVLIKDQTDFDNTRNVIIASSMLVLGLGGAIISFTSGNFTLTFSGMSLAAIVGIVFNLILPSKAKG